MGRIGYGVGDLIWRKVETGLVKGGDGNLAVCVGGFVKVWGGSGEGRGLELAQGGRGLVWGGDGRFAKMGGTDEQVKGDIVRGGD